LPLLLFYFDVDIVLPEFILPLVRVQPPFGLLAVGKCLALLLKGLCISAAIGADSVRPIETFVRQR
jgi:hypothetical protein